MYAIPVSMEPILRTNSALREYARNEYGSDNVAWFLAAIRRSSRKATRPSIASHLRLRRAPHAHRIVGHRGTPRLAPSDLRPAA